MRILIAGQTYYPGSNGQAIFTIHLAEGLAEAGHDVMALVPSYSHIATHETVCSVQVEKRPSLTMGIFHPESFITAPLDFKIGSILDGFRPQIVHVQDHYPIAHNVSTAARHRGIAIIGTNHFLPENILPYVPRWVPRKLGIRVLWATMLMVYNQFDLVTTPTETAAGILRQQAIHPPVVPVSCGVDTRRFYPIVDLDRSAIRRKYGLDPDKALFLYVGRLDREKRIDLLVEAFGHLGQAGAQLGIGGQGAQAAALREQIHRLKLEQQVILTGYIPHPDLPLLLNSADIFCMPSPEELQSIATLEAMAVGRPILAANARALPELVADGVNGLLFVPDDAGQLTSCLAALLDDRAAWGRMGQASLQRAQVHSLANTIFRYTELYQQLVSQGNAR
ncbi:MAG: glycosyltransferase [Anaerolineaceae bacterium]|nr:glycosyltransferase [Anaerolineaceae bacterium]